jgi:hypothetical protein
MNTLLVGYDLNKQGQDYEALIDHLKKDGNWWHHLDSTWLISTQKTATELRDELVNLGLVDSNDELLVISVKGDHAAWYGFTDKGSKWLKDNL